MKNPALATAGVYRPRFHVMTKKEREAHPPFKYVNLEGFRYYSKRHKKWVTCEAGMFSDGATGAKDLRRSMSWWVHDVLCSRKTWDDGTKVTNWQASKVLSDILKAEGYKLRTRTWKWATFLLGGWGIKRKNGWV